jgi:hypothetical protein
MNNIHQRIRINWMVDGQPDHWNFATNYVMTTSHSRCTVFRIETHTDIYTCLLYAKPKRLEPWSLPMRLRNISIKITNFSHTFCGRMFRTCEVNLKTRLLWSHCFTLFCHIFRFKRKIQNLKSTISIYTVQNSFFSRH